MGMRTKGLIGVVAASLVLAGIVAVAVSLGGAAGARGGERTGCTSSAGDTCTKGRTQCAGSADCDAAACPELGAGLSARGACSVPAVDNACSMLRSETGPGVGTGCSKGRGIRGT